MNKEGFGKFGEGWKGNLREEEEQGYSGERRTLFSIQLAGVHQAVGPC
jgi:hypothetical protein